MKDIHSHVLPEIDDGCRNTAESCEVLSVMKESGIDLVCATPHFSLRRCSISEFLEKREESLEKLLGAARENGTRLPDLVLGAEVSYFNGMCRMKELEKLCYTGTKSLLVELPNERWDGDVYNELQEIGINLGIVPVLAHVNRYMQFGNDFKKIARFGFPIQLDTDLFFGSFFTRRKWLKTVTEGNNIVLASDTHGMAQRPPQLVEATEEIARRLGEDVIRNFNKNCDLVLDKHERVLYNTNV